MGARGALRLAAGACALAVLLTGCSGGRDNPPAGATSSPSATASNGAGQDLAADVLSQVSATPPADLGHATVRERSGSTVVYTVTSLRADSERTLLTLSVRNESGQSLTPSAFSGVENAFGHDAHGLAVVDKAGNLRVTPYRYQLVPDKPTMACVCVRERFLKDVVQQWTIELPPVSAAATTVDVQIPEDRQTRVFGPVKIGATITSVPVSRG